MPEGQGFFIIGLEKFICTLDNKHLKENGLFESKSAQITVPSGWACAMRKPESRARVLLKNNKQKNKTQMCLCPNASIKNDWWTLSGVVLSLGEPNASHHQRRTLQLPLNIFYFEQIVFWWAFQDKLVAKWGPQTLN